MAATYHGCNSSGGSSRYLVITPRLVGQVARLVMQMAAARMDPVQREDPDFDPLQQDDLEPPAPNRGSRLSTVGRAQLPLSTPCAHAQLSAPPPPPPGGGRAASSEAASSAIYPPTPRCLPPYAPLSTTLRPAIYPPTPRYLPP